ncbi:VOC family protein [Metasolibacillus meyeri]
MPFLWFGKQAKEATNFYQSLFEDSTIIDVQTMKGIRRARKSSPSIK